MPKATNVEGMKVNYLTGIGFSRYKERKSSRVRLYFWKCDCGNIIEATVSAVNNHCRKSCGCKNPDIYTGVMSVAYQVFGDSYKDGDLEFEQYYELSQQPCFYCGAPPSNKRYTRKEVKTRHCFISNGLDRIDNTKKHNLNNVVACCWECNMMKRDKTKEEFFNKVKAIYEKHLG